MNIFEAPENAVYHLNEAGDAVTGTINPSTTKTQFVVGGYGKDEVHFTYRAGVYTVITESENSLDSLLKTGVPDYVTYQVNPPREVRDLLGD